MVRHGRDETHRARSARKTPIASRPHPVGQKRVIHRLEPTYPRSAGSGVDNLAQLAGGHGIAGVPLLGTKLAIRVFPSIRCAKPAIFITANGHVLDKAHVHGAIDREICHAKHVLIESANHHAIHLHGIKPVLQRRIYARKSLLQAPQAGDFEKLDGI